MYWITVNKNNFNSGRLHGFLRGLSHFNITERAAYVDR